MSTSLIRSVPKLANGRPDIHSPEWANYKAAMAAKGQPETERRLRREIVRRLEELENDMLDMLR